MELWFAVRTAFIERRLEAAIGPSGARQVVLLGAGLDTRAARLGREGVRFFEVDHPASQQEKLLRLAGINGYPVASATYVRCDFEHDDFLERLVADGFDPDAPAFIVWEGVTSYLTEPAVRATFARIARGCDARSTVIFDHIGRKMAEGQLRNTSDRGARAMVADLGEPVRWGTDHVLPLLYEEGFRRVRATTFDEAGLNLLGTYDRARKWRFQYLVEASVALGAV
jgi:methyltransferase (TIGR00027 family)